MCTYKTKIMLSPITQRALVATLGVFTTACFFVESSLAPLLLDSGNFIRFIL